MLYENTKNKHNTYSVFTDIITSSGKVFSDTADLIWLKVFEQFSSPFPQCQSYPLIIFDNKKWDRISLYTYVHIMYPATLAAADPRVMYTTDRTH